MTFYLDLSLVTWINLTASDFILLTNTLFAGYFPLEDCFLH